MPIVNISDDVLNAMEASGVEGIVTAAKNLKASKDVFVPKGRMDEVIVERNELRSQVTTLEGEKSALVTSHNAEKTTLQQKAAALETELNTVKPAAEKYDGVRKAKVQQLKDKMKDNFLPEYEAMSMESIDKLLVANGAAPPVDNGGSGGGDGKIKSLAGMKPEEREAHIQAAKDGKLKTESTTT